MDPGIGNTASRRMNGAFLLGILILCMLCACQKKPADLPPAPRIQQPLESAFYYPGERIQIQAEADGRNTFSHMELYVEGAFVLETSHWSLDTLLEFPLSEPGPLAISLRACDVFGQCRETSVSVEILEEQGESGAMETFDQANITGWFLSDWARVSEEGFDDVHALRSTSGGVATAITRFTFPEAGHISFRVKDGEECLDFLVDGMMKARCFDQPGWGEYAYAIAPGEHVFKWIAREEGTSIDRVVFTPGRLRHTPGEYFGGGIIFYLDSTGQHGLIGALRDGQYQGRPEIPWGCYGVPITSGNRAQSSHDGAANTLAIVTSCQMEQIAARYCHDLQVSDGEDAWEDWYLPAVHELKLLYSHRRFLEDLEGQYYWTSTSLNTTGASVIDFRDGAHHGAHRSIPNVSGPVAAGIHVRPIRKF